MKRTTRRCWTLLLKTQVDCWLKPHFLVELSKNLRVHGEELAAVVSVAMPNKNPTVKELLGEWYRVGEFTMAPCLWS